MASEDGWEPGRLAPDSDQLEWVTVPGTSVTLQIMKGWPSIVLRAWAADFNAYVEPLRDADSACYTPTNSVATSNHLNATGMDLNWDSHPFHAFNTFTGYQQQVLTEMFAFYEDNIAWGGKDWGGNPQDEMHFQMGYGTWNNPRVGDFIKRKIRSDGFSTFRRGATVPPPVLSRADRYALATIAEGQRLGITPRGIKIALSVELVETNLTMYANSNDPPSLNLPHDAVGSDHMSSGLYQQQPAWGSLEDRMDPTRSATIFFTVDNGGGVRGLTKIRYTDARGIVVFYDYNDTSHTPGFYAQKVQGSAFPDRYDQRFADAEALYNRLVSQTGEGDLSAEAERLISEIHGAFFNQVPSQSIYATPGEGDKWQLHEFIKNDDGMLHPLHVENAARLGDLRELGRIALVAAGKGRTTDPSAVVRARNVLAEIEANNPEILQAFLASQNGATK